MWLAGSCLWPQARRGLTPQLRPVVLKELTEAFRGAAYQVWSWEDDREIMRMWVRGNLWELPRRFILTLHDFRWVLGMGQRLRCWPRR